MDQLMQILEDILGEEQGSGWQAFMHDEFLSKFIARFVIAYHVTKLCDPEATKVVFLVLEKRGQEADGGPRDRKSVV